MEKDATNLKIIEPEIDGIQPIQNDNLNSDEPSPQLVVVRHENVNWNINVAMIISATLLGLAAVITAVSNF